MKRAAIALSFAVVLAFPGFAVAAPGKDIRQACGASFGQLISGNNGERTHTNYAGGAKAFSNPAILAAHGCTN